MRTFGHTETMLRKYELEASNELETSNEDM